jgi:CubicO group peptidase (beta-lactamase class C family)
MIARMFCIAAILGVCLLVLGGCTETPAPVRAPWPTQDWQRATPEQHGLDSAALGQALDTMETRKVPIHSLLIVRHGYLVLEVYFYPYDGRTLHSWASVTKSVTSALVGLAVDQGAIQSTRRRMVQFFPEYQATLTGGKDRITVGHLLSMTGGLECGYRKGEIEALEMQRSPNFVAAVLQLPMHAPPGREFSYCSGGMHLLSAMVTRATGRSALAFARQGLFEPLGIKDVAWPADPQGINYGWSDLRLHPRDMAKIGYLYLRHGEWDGRQLLSADWIRRSTRRQVRVTQGDADYGYGWWIGPRDMPGMVQAVGRGGQRIVIWPDQDLVVIMNGAGLDPGRLTPLLLPALRSDRALPHNAPAQQRLQEKIARAARTPRPTAPPRLPARAQAISGHEYVFESNLLGLTSASLHFDRRDEARMRIAVGDRLMTARVGLDGVYHAAPPTPGEPTPAAQGYWHSQDEFSVDYLDADGVNHYQLTFRFRDQRLTLHIVDQTGLFPDQVVHGVTRR